MKRYTTNFHSILLTALCTALTALYSCTGDTDIDSFSGNGNSPATGTPLEVRATVAPFQSPDASTSPATRAAIDNISTKFQTGDAIGLICFRSGATGNYISDDISNLKLVFSGTDGVGTWKTEDGGDPINYSDAISYMAYYPYSPTVDLTGVTDEAAAKTAILESYPTDYLVNQQIPENFAKSDHMIAVSTPQDMAGTPTLTLNFKHEFVMLIVKPMRFYVNIPPMGVTAYSYFPMRMWKIDDKLVEQNVQGQKIRMEIQGNNACQMSDGSYAILLPIEAFSIIDYVMIDYKTKNGSNTELTVSTQTASHTPVTEYYKAGTCHLIEVHNSNAEDGTVERALQAADFVCTANGTIEIIPGDCPVDADGKIPNYEAVAGVVVTCDPTRMTDEECKKSGWDHAYVMGLQNITQGGYTLWASESNTPLDIPLISTEKAESDMNGYTETQAVMTSVSDLTKYPIYNALKDYRDNNPIIYNSKKISPWFIPSIGQWFDVLTNLGGKSPNDFSTISSSWSDNGYSTAEIINKMNSQLAKVGYTLIPKTSSKAVCLLLSSKQLDISMWCFSAKFRESVPSNVSLTWSLHFIPSPEVSYEVVTARPFFAF